MELDDDDVRVLRLDGELDELDSVDRLVDGDDELDSVDRLIDELDEDDSDNELDEELLTVLSNVLEEDDEMLGLDADDEDIDDLLADDAVLTRVELLEDSVLIWLELLDELWTVELDEDCVIDDMLVEDSDEGERDDTLLDEFDCVEGDDTLLDELEDPVDTRVDDEEDDEELSSPQSSANGSDDIGCSPSIGSAQQVIVFGNRPTRCLSCYLVLPPSHVADDLSTEGLLGPLAVGKFVHHRGLAAIAWVNPFGVGDLRDGVQPAHCGHDSRQLFGRHAEIDRGHWFSPITTQHHPSDRKVFPTWLHPQPAMRSVRRRRRPSVSRPTSKSRSHPLPALWGRQNAPAVQVPA